MIESEHVGMRYGQWLRDVEPDLAPGEKAAGHEKFAAEFETLPPNLEPSAGWGEMMAYLCRRIARRRRDQPVGEFAPLVSIPAGAVLAAAQGSNVCEREYPQ